MRVDPDGLIEFVAEALGAVGVPEEDAEIAAEAIVEGDLRGFHSHGVMRLPGYLEGIERGAIRKEAKVEKVSIGEAVETWDAHRSLGHVVGSKAADRAVELASEYGIGAIAVRRSSHFGIAGYYATLIAEADMVGFVTCGTEPAVAPYGGTEAVLGTNPFTVAFPRRDGPPIVIDMATSEVARGKLLQAAKEGRDIPEGWAIGPDGEPTTDPREALEGALLPFGGRKGYLVCLALEILAGPVVGAAAGKDVKGTTDPTVPCNKGDVFVALDVGSVTGLHDYFEDLERLLAQIRSSGEEVVIPGEPEFERREEAFLKGLKLPKASEAALEEVAKRYGLEDELEALKLRD